MRIQQILESRICKVRSSSIRRRQPPVYSSAAAPAFRLMPVVFYDLSSRDVTLLL